MREAEFRAWFEANDYDAATIGTQLARAKRIEQSYGDLDELFRDGKLAALKAELSYSTADERANRPNPAKFPVNGNIRNSMASYCSTIEYYSKFSASADRSQPDNGQNITSDAIEAAMDEFDAIGLEGFKSQYGFGRPQKYWVRRSSNGKLYPAKAIVGVSHGHVPGGVPLKASDFYGGQGEQAANGTLRKLGYEIVEKGSPESSERAFALYDAEGHEYQPTRTFNQRTGVSAFRLQRPGTSNRTEDAEEVEATVDVARAMLLDGRLARVKRTDGTGPANYIGYGKTKLVRYRLDADLARQIGVPAQGGVDGLSGHASSDQKEQDPMPQPVALPTNLILYGPPGTGKTYNTAFEAVRLCDGAAAYAETPEGRSALMERYNTLVKDERIGFVTFHQNYGYEDFVEGLRPSTYGEDGEPLSAGFRLAPEAGIFTKMAERAEALRSDRKDDYDFAGKRFFKMSLGEVANPEDDYLFDEAIEGGFVHMGDDGGMDWSEPIFTTKELMIAGYAERHPELPVQHPNNGIIEFPFRLRARARIGDIIVVSKGNLLFRAIGEVTGEYHQVPRENDDYTMRRAVKWLWVDRDGVSHDVIYGKRFSQRTIYEFTDSELKLEAIGALIDSGRDGPDSGPVKQFVLIIDEINRANVSKVFGELITLLEPDKRAGMTNALSVTLPYSKRSFSVPANLHVIGTMNTADRSIAQLDTALRRRFNFQEIAPDPSLLADASKRTGIDLVRVLTTINQRIEYLIDREHRIGHAFFIGCETAEQVQSAMRDKVIPLLQEYFFEDWSRIHAVLGNGFIREDKLDPPPGIEGDRVSSWSVLDPFKPDAFERLTGKVVDVPAEADE